nr:PREDICTED: polycomb group protein Psc-like [Bemisia tabaci]
MPGVKLTDVNPELVCVLCHGYFIDATAIKECLHSFCRSCIILYLEAKNYCPKCQVPINTSKPHLSLKPDKTRQDIVYKLVPGLFHSEMRRRQEFYQKNRFRDLHLHPEARGVDVDRLIYSPEDSISLSLEYYDSDREKEEWSKGVAAGEKTTVNTSITPDLASSPGGSPEAAKESVTQSPNKQLDRSTPRKRYLQCPAEVSMRHLKKFVRMKYELPPEASVELFYKRESLPDDYSLMDIAYIYTWKRNGPMRFYYRIHSPRRVLCDSNASVKEASAPETELFVPAVSASEPKPPSPAVVEPQVPSLNTTSIPQPETISLNETHPSRKTPDESQSVAKAATPPLIEVDTIEKVASKKGFEERPSSPRSIVLVPTGESPGKPTTPSTTSITASTPSNVPVTSRSKGICYRKATSPSPEKPADPMATYDFTEDKTPARNLEKSINSIKKSGMKLNGISKTNGNNVLLKSKSSNASITNDNRRVNTATPTSKAQVIPSSSVTQGVNTSTPTTTAQTSVQMHLPSHAPSDKSPAKNPQVELKNPSNTTPVPSNPGSNTNCVNTPSQNIPKNTNCVSTPNQNTPKNTNCVNKPSQNTPKNSALTSSLSDDKKLQLSVQKAAVENVNPKPTQKSRPNQTVGAKAPSITSLPPDGKVQIPKSKDSIKNFESNSNGKTAADLPRNLSPWKVSCAPIESKHSEECKSPAKIPHVDRSNDIKKPETAKQTHFESVSEKFRRFEKELVNSKPNSPTPRQKLSNAGSFVSGKLVNGTKLPFTYETKQNENIPTPLPAKDNKIMQKNMSNRLNPIAAKKPSNGAFDSPNKSVTPSGNIPNRKNLANGCSPLSGVQVTSSPNQIEITKRKRSELERCIKTENGCLSVSLLSQSQQEAEAKKMKMVQPDVSIQLMSFSRDKKVDTPKAPPHQNRTALTESSKAKDNLSSKESPKLCISTKANVSPPSQQSAQGQKRENSGPLDLSSGDSLGAGCGPSVKIEKLSSSPPEKRKKMPPLAPLRVPPLGSLAELAQRTGQLQKSISNQNDLRDFSKYPKEAIEFLLRHQFNNNNDSNGSNESSKKLLDEFVMNCQNYAFTPPYSLMRPNNGLSTENNHK